MPLWQPVGYSTHQITSKVGHYFNTIASHTGTLDPMAEGVIIMLLGSERFKKIDYAGWTKKYEFEIAFGISTDSYDGLGLITDLNFDSHPDINALQKTLLEMVGNYTQEVPPFSAKKLNGKHLFEYARRYLHIGQPVFKEGSIYNMELLNLYKIPFGKLVFNIIEKIDQVEGEFRQNEIKEFWQKTLEKSDSQKYVSIAKVSVEISRGMYVRSLSQDICKKLGTTGFVCSLVRTKNGEYSQEDCSTLEDIFGNDFDKHRFFPKYKARAF